MPLRWKAFSLEQVNLEADANPDELWATAERRRGLLPLAAMKWAEARGEPVLQTVQRAFFEARHGQGRKIGRPEVVAEVLSEAGLDGPAICREVCEDRRWLRAARDDHEEGVRAGVFGVPTLLLGDCGPLFVRLLEVPQPSRRVEVWERVRAVACEPLLHELKRPSMG